MSRTGKVFQATLLFFWLMGAKLLAQGTMTIGFDDLDAPDWSGDPVPTNYLGLQWSNFSVYDQSHAGTPGYAAGIVSAPNAVFNDGGYPATISSSGQFDLMSAYVNAAWENGIIFEARGYLGNDQLYDVSFGLQPTAPELIQFDFLGVNSVEFLSYGEWQANQFTMDDITIVIPEPTLGSLTVLGLCVRIAFAWCRREVR